MMNGNRSILLPALALAGLFFAAQPGPANEVSPGYRAQAEGRWSEAAESYRRTLANEPQRADIWLRLAEVELQLEEDDAALEALENALENAGDDQELLLELAKAYGGEGRPELGLRPLRRLTELDPDTVGYWLLDGQFANWAGDPARAARSYARAWELDPANREAAHSVAQSLAWSFDYDAAIPAYRRYLEAFPDDDGGWIELGWLLYWSGKLEQTDEVLDEYKARFGRTSRYKELRSRMLVMADRPAKALAYNAELLAEDPESFDHRVTRMLALWAHREPKAAMAEVAEIETRFPDREQTDPVTKYVRVPLMHHLDARFSYYGDTDEIDIFGAQLSATLFAQPQTRFTFGYAWEQLRAEENTGLETVDGSTRIEDQKYWGFLRHRIDHWLAVDGSIGGGMIEDGDDYLHYSAAIELDPTDALHMRLEGGETLYAVSPRAVSEEVMETYLRLSGDITADRVYTILYDARISDYSDDNQSWKAFLVPRRAVVRKPGFLVDVGISGEWISFDENLDNGYYDPDFYQRYALVGYFFWLQSENNTFGLVADVGMHEDDDNSSFRFGENISLQATLGVYKSWMFHFDAGFLERHNENETFRAWSANALLRYRF